ncbi:MAG: DNA repair protein RecN, partial [Acidimicrobiales bacterium]
MLTELHVRDLGVIDEVRIDLGTGMTALTGETGAGKTLIVEALELLLGGRADPVLVRPGGDEASVEGRFVSAGASPGDTDNGEGDMILARAVPAGGRSRAWIDGRMAQVSALAEVGSRLVDLHGQHSQQSLLDPAAQRKALDAFGGVDVEKLRAARATQAEISKELEATGGDERVRAREADLLRYQLDEIAKADITGPDEDDELAGEEERLAEAAAHREAAASALDALDGSSTGERGGAGALDLIGRAVAAIGERAPLAPIADRLGAAQAELSDLATELRTVTETWEDDPGRLLEVQARRQLLRELSRKYGEGPGGVLAYASDARQRLEALEASEQRAEVLGAKLLEAGRMVAEAEVEVGTARRDCAGRLAQEVQRRLRTLAMPRARIEVSVGDEDPGDEVAFGLGANPGEPVLPLTKVASGGELARAMLALRLVLSDAPPTMVFDEV